MIWDTINCAQCNQALLYISTNGLQAAPPWNGALMQTSFACAMATPSNWPLTHIHAVLPPLNKDG